MNLDQLINFLLSLIFPLRCSTCKIRIKSGAWCADCRKKIIIRPSFICPTCRRRCPEPYLPCHPKNNFLLIAPTSFEQPEIRELIHSLKYDGLKSAAQEMADLIGQNIGKHIATLLNPEKTFIVPIPLHPTKLKQRGFNQSEQLALEITKKLGERWRVKNILTRNINNKSQTKCLNKQERIENVRGIFTVHQKLEGQDLIVVDDVFTSGATMQEAIRTLKKAGASRIIVLTFAEA